MHRLCHKLILIISLLALALPALSQVKGYFNCDDSVSCGPMLVKFTYYSGTIQPTQYNWDFGNGQTSDIMNPAVQYDIPGKYTVTLITVDGQLNSDTIIKTNYIIIHNKPIADFILKTPSKGCIPLSVVFEQAVILADTTIKNYLWDFGDNHSANSAIVNNTYVKGGNYNLMLHVTDNNNCEDIIYKDSLITAYAKPSVDFSSTESISCNDTLTVRFNQVSNIENAKSYLWNFGDNGYSNVQSPYHKYQDFGSYNVKCVITDNNNCVDSIEKSNYVILNKVYRNIQINKDIICRNTLLPVINTSTGINNYKWDFGDGTYSTDSNPVKHYKNSGNFTLKIITTFNGFCTDTIIKAITVDSIKAGFVSNKNHLCELPAVVSYKDASIGASTWNWKFGNGKTSNQVDPEVTYVKNAFINKNLKQLYSDTLIVSSEAGCYDTLIVDSSVFVILPNIYFTPNDSSQYTNLIEGCAPLTINFQNKSVATDLNDTISEFKWTFGGTVESIEKNPVYQFNELDSIQVVLNVINESGCTNSDSITIRTGKPLVADFSYDIPDEICGSEKVQLFDESRETGLANAWKWEFSDETNSKEKNPEHVFLDTGYVGARLTVFYNGCFDEGSVKEVKGITYVKGPAGNLSYQLDCSKPHDFTFANEINDFDRFYWRFGDGTGDSTQNLIVKHTYKNKSYYMVGLTAENNRTGCSLQVNGIINVSDVKADFNIDNIHACVDDSVYFDPKPSIDEVSFPYENESVKYIWDFDDKEIPSNDAIKFKFLEKGEHRIVLTVKGANGCVSTVGKTIKSYKPKALFTMDDSIGCIPLLVNFTNLSVTDTLWKSFKWDFGDEIVSNETTPQHKFQKNNQFNIKLVAEDALGCKDTMIKAGSVLASRPMPNFTIGKQTVCLKDSIKFVNNSPGMGILCDWHFGDGTTSDEFSPIHAYSDTGKYDISLYMIDSLGCDTLSTFPGYLKVVGLPKADFNLKIHNVSCYPALVEFTDNSLGDSIVTWNWDFGDKSQNSAVKNPLHTYNQSGNFNVSLKVTTVDGCTDTDLVENLVKIKGPYAAINLKDTTCKDVPFTMSMLDSTNIYYFEWVLSNNEIINDYSFDLQFHEFGEHEVSLYLKSDSAGTCDKIINKKTFVPTLISAYVVDDSMGCAPHLVNFAENAVGAYSYFWEFEEGGVSISQDPAYTFTRAGNYSVKLLVSNTSGCNDSSFKNILVNPLPTIILSDDMIICRDDTATVVATGGVGYKWLANNEITNNITPITGVFPDSTRRYVVEVVDSNLCVDTAGVTIFVQQKPVSVVYSNDTMIIIGDEVELSAGQSGGDYFKWSPNDNISCVDCFSVFAKPVEKTVYKFIVMDRNECFSVYDSVQISIDYKYSVDLPNAFTPNNDGINDVIYVKGWGIKELLDFSVYNANNKKVFQTQDINVGWDGTDNMVELPAGVYYYSVKVLGYDDIQREKAGSIFILK